MWSGYGALKINSMKSRMRISVKIGRTEVINRERVNMRMMREGHQ